ncbi:MAG: hypothetical protein HUJ26_19535 [Planctomycetaceae bacterium]|nr:hypothetical protein [Planctomycetaceae bacterium]
MQKSQTPIEFDSLKKSQRPTSSTITGTIITAVLGTVSAFGIFSLTVGSVSPQSAQAQQVAQSPTQTKTNATDEPVFDDSSTPEIPPDEVLENGEPTVLLNNFAEPLVAEKPTVNETVEAKPQATAAKSVMTQNPEDEHEDAELSTRRWTNLILFRGNPQGDSTIPDKFPVWNYPKGYEFSGSRHDQHRLGRFRLDGEFIIRNGTLVRVFGGNALLHLPPAENFDMEGIVGMSGTGGWLALLGWDIQSKSGYVLYNTRLRVSGSKWFLIEIKDGKAVPNSERFLVDRTANGQGALRLRVENKKVSLQAAGTYICKDEEMPNYQEGHVALGTYSPFYGPQNFVIKSLRMKLNK